MQNRLNVQKCLSKAAENGSARQFRNPNMFVVVDDSASPAG